MDVAAHGEFVLAIGWDGLMGFLVHVAAVSQSMAERVTFQWASEKSGC